jgi:hypothetical protein
VVHGPVANSGSVIDVDDEQASRNGVFAWLAVEKRDVFRSLVAILCGRWGWGSRGVDDGVYWRILSHVEFAGSGTEGLACLFSERMLKV